MAPAWLTHRRALEAVGESRRAQAWTIAAVRLAREAVETGRERLEGGVGTPLLVAGPLPDVAARPEHATGRLLPATASDERDTHDQAGILTDAEVDLLLLEPRTTLEATLVALRIVTQTGLPVWATVPLIGATDEPPFDDRVVMTIGAGASGVLVDLEGAPDGDQVAEAMARAAPDAGVPLGLVGSVPPLATSEEDLDGWLRAGVGVLGILGGADPAALKPLTDARRRVGQLARERQDARRTSLGAWLLDAARRAPGGRALWLGVQEMAPPPGFDWTIILPADASLTALPDEAFRLIVSLGELAPGPLARLVEHGGVVAFETGTDGVADRLAGTGLRIQEIQATPDGRHRFICRREGA